jgi:hypothetical protein
MELCRGLAFVFGALMLMGCPAETDTNTGGTPSTGPECEEDNDCPKGECETATCNAGSCATAPLEDGAEVDIQTGGDCLEKVCDGAGAIKEIADEEDTPNAGGACVTYMCGPGGLEFVFNNGAVCDEDKNRYCLENPQEDDLDNYECVECTQDSHCKSNICDEQEGSCSPDTCGNTMLDGEETAVDCGGNECPGCANGLACVEDNDCVSNECQDDECVPDDG